MPEPVPTLMIVCPNGPTRGSLVDLLGDVLVFDVEGAMPSEWEAGWELHLDGAARAVRGRFRVVAVRRRSTRGQRVVARVLEAWPTDRTAHEFWQARRIRSAPATAKDAPSAPEPQPATAVVRGIRHSQWNHPVEVAPAPSPSGTTARPPRRTAVIKVVVPPATPRNAPVAATPAPAEGVLGRMSMIVNRPVRPMPEVKPVMKVVVRAAEGAAAIPQSLLKDRVDVAAIPDVALRRRALPEQASPVVRSVLFSVQTRANQPLLYTAEYAIESRYQCDWWDQLQWGGLVMDLPPACSAGTAVELRLVTPDGRATHIPATVLSASPLATSLALAWPETDKIRFHP